MGKLLRLLDDERAAVTIYNVGLKRAISGLEEIKVQLAKIQQKIERSRSKSLDPFEKFSVDVIHKIIFNISTESLRSIKDISKMSRASLDFIRSAKSMIPMTSTITKNMSLTLTKGCLRHCSLNVMCKGDGLLNILKVFSKGTVSDILIKNLEIEGYHSSVQIHELLLAASYNGAFSNLQSLTLTSCNLDCSFLTLMLKGSSGLRHLKIQDSIFGSSVAFLESQNNIQSIVLKNASGPADIAIIDALIKLTQLRSLVWNKIDAAVFLAERKLATMKNLRKLGVHANMLLDISLTLPLRNSIRELYISSDINPGNVNYSKFESFPLLKRLRISGSFCTRNDEEPVSLPNLEDLFIENMNDIPAVAKWHLPKLRSFSIYSSDLVFSDQIPSVQNMNEFLFARNCRYLRPICYKEIVDRFETGKIKILGIGDAYRLYQSDGIGKVKAVSDKCPFQTFLVNEDAILERIHKRWRL